MRGSTSGLNIRELKKIGLENILGIDSAGLAGVQISEELFTHAGLN